jgi:hypothetical protein
MELENDFNATAYELGNISKHHVSILGIFALELLEKRNLHNISTNQDCVAYCHEK